jgi:hypothetical protein
MRHLCIHKLDGVCESAWHWGIASEVNHPNGLQNRAEVICFSAEMPTYLLCPAAATTVLLLVLRSFPLDL